MEQDAAGEGRGLLACDGVRSGGHRISFPETSRKTSSRLRAARLSELGITPWAAHHDGEGGQVLGCERPIGNVAAGACFADGNGLGKDPGEVEPGFGFEEERADVLAGLDGGLPLEKLRNGTFRDVPAGVDDVDVVGQPLRVVHEVGGEDDSHAGVPQLGNELKNQLPRLRVQSGAGLVQEQDLGIADEGRCQGQPLLLAAGEPAHRRPGEGIDAEPFNEFVNGTRAGVHPGNVAQERNGPGRRREPAVLKHHANTGAQVCPGTAGILSQQRDGSTAARLETLGAFDGGSFSCAVGAQQGGHLAAFGDEGDAAHHPEHLSIQAGQRTNILNEPADGQNRGFGGSHPSILRDVVLRPVPGLPAPQVSLALLERGSKLRHDCVVYSMTNATAVPVAGHGAPRTTPDRGHVAVSPAADPDERTRDRVLGAVLEHGPISAAELGDMLGFTPAAVRRHLDHLDRSGVIEVKRVAKAGAGAGRPARRYVLSSQGQSTLGNDYLDIATLALKQLQEVAGHEAVRAVRRRALRGHGTPLRPRNRAGRSRTSLPGPRHWPRR